MTIWHWLLLAIAAFAWLHFVQHPSTRRLEKAVVDTLSAG